MADTITEAPIITKITQEINTQPGHETSVENLSARKERIKKLAIESELKEKDKKFTDMMVKAENEIKSNIEAEHKEIESTETAVKTSLNELKERFSPSRKPMEIPVSDK